MRRHPFLASLVLAICGMSGCAPRDRPKSLLVITMDTTRADRLGPYGYSEARTPTIDRLASEGTLFERAYAVTPETLPSHASLFTGLYPPSHSVRLNLVYRLPEEAVTLAELLRERGFYTVGVCSASVLDRRYGLGQGFDVYDGPKLDDDRPQKLFERSAQTVTEKALAHLAEREDRPYFLWVHYYDPHGPFDPREPFQAPDELPPESPQRYDLEIAYTDYWIGKLLDAMEARGDLEDTLVVLTADHGESLGDHGETYHTLFIYDSTIHVPLILAGPGVPAGKRVGETVSSVDLFATLLAYFDVEPPPSSSRILPALSPSPETDRGARFAYSDSMTPPLRYGWNALEAIRTRDWLYVRAPDEELYRLDGSDPGNEENLFSKDPELGARLRGALERAIRDMPRTGLEERARRKPSEQEIRALAALGYVGGSSDDVPEIEASGQDPKDMVEVAEAIQIAQLAEQLGRRETAKELLTWAAEVDPENFGVWVQLGRTLFAEESYGEAMKAWEHASDLRPGSWEVRVELSAAEEALGHLESAESRLAEALETSPFPKEVWRKLARLRAQQQDFGAAEEAFRMILEIDPEDERARHALDRLEQRRPGSVPNSAVSDEHP